VNATKRTVELPGFGAKMSLGYIAESYRPTTTITRSGQYNTGTGRIVIAQLNECVCTGDAYGGCNHYSSNCSPGYRPHCFSFGGGCDCECV
jgi:hypothetical protein